jgi:hypothetical protein
VAVSALVQVLRDIRAGEYRPSTPIVHGLAFALELAMADAEGNERHELASRDR